MMAMTMSSGGGAVSESTLPVLKRKGRKKG